MTDCILAIDTSNYTTSVAILDFDGTVVANLKAPLKVKAGECGLRQSDAVFSHIVNLPQLMKEAGRYLINRRVVAVGVSEKPRNVEGSYMPCFLAGVSSAEAVGAALGVPVYRFSHQCGHIMAAIYSSGRDDFLDSDFFAFHISGGTTELVRVSPCGRDFATELIGGTADVNAGQIVDRIGVFLGLPFPAGVYMEELAKKNTHKIPKKKISINDKRVNLSGLENLAKKLYDDTGNKELCAAFVLDYISKAIISIMDACNLEYGKSSYLLAGGVMSNDIIRKNLSENYDVSFAEPSLSTDNAVGIAALALKAYVSAGDK